MEQRRCRCVYENKKEAKLERDGLQALKLESNKLEAERSQEGLRILMTVP